MSSSESGYLIKTVLDVFLNTDGFLTRKEVYREIDGYYPALGTVSKVIRRLYSDDLLWREGKGICGEPYRYRLKEGVDSVTVKKYVKDFKWSW